MKNLIYLDNAATSFPKPPEVLTAMANFMEEVGANPGRSGHPLSVKASRIVGDTRESLARLFHVKDPERIVFTLNVTESLNMVFSGFLRQGDHVIASAIEHNSVMRPLKYLEETGRITLSIAPCDRKGFLDPDELPRLLRKDTALMVLNHASNVCGTIQNVKAVKDAVGDVPLLLDAAQTAGCLPIDVERQGIDFLAFTGHKALFGPQGTGGLYVREGLSLQPLKRGGTGSVSEKFEQPDFMPDIFESGTRNNVGIAGLGAGVDFILREGVSRIREHDRALTAALLSSLHAVPGLTVYGPLKPELQTSTVSITFESILPTETENVHSGCGSINLGWLEEGVSPREADDLLTEKFEILVRTGLHCSPLAHQTLGTYPDGSIRLSMGYFNTLEEMEVTARAIREIADR